MYWFSAQELENFNRVAEADGHTYPLRWISVLYVPVWFTECRPVDSPAPLGRFNDFERLIETDEGPCGGDGSPEDDINRE